MIRALMIDITKAVARETAQVMTIEVGCSSGASAVR